MLDKNAENNRTKLLKEISDVKDRLLLLEELADDELLDLPGVNQLSDDQVQNIRIKLRTAGTCINLAKDFLVVYTKQTSGGSKK